jgi:predicted outer membrane lipoprotein
VKIFLTGLACLAFAIIAAIWIMDSREQSRDSAAVTVPHFQTSQVRRVAITDEARVSRNQDPVYVQLVDGAIPAGVTHLTVLTDENCTPDADGVSHCINRVQFETGQGIKQAVLQHQHRMSEESCLAPGEVVELAAA